jgi:KDO2-lipid IV(A) lauroyltransferase
VTGTVPKRRSRLKQRGEQVLLIAVGAVFPRLPEAFDAIFGNLLGWLAASVLRVRRRTVDRNLLAAFPERSPGWRRKVARAAYRHFSAESLALLRFKRMSKSQVADRLEIDGLDLLHQAVASGKGAILLAGHFGNWEIAALGVAARGIPLDVVVRRQRNPWFDDHIRGIGRRFGVGVVYRDEATREVPRRLRQSRLVALVSDQNAPRGGIFVDFFGRPAATARGPGVLGLRTGTTILFLDPKRVPGLRARYRMGVTPLSIDVAKTMDDRVRALMRAFVRELEMRITEAPEQYFWFHDRWKTRPEAEGRNEPVSPRADHPDTAKAES